MNKIILFLILMILLANPVIAKTIEEDLYEGENIETPGYNITLMVIGNNEDSIVTCINGEIYLIDKGQKKEIGELWIRPDRIYKNYVKVTIRSCEDCECDESCSNALCFSEQPSGEQTNESSEENSGDINNQQENIQQEKNQINIFSIILFVIVLILLIILLTKKRGR